jgi:DNA-binding transcriptional regulator YiaG
MTIRDFLRTSDDLTLQQWATRFKTTVDRVRAWCDEYRCITRDYRPEEL